MMIIVVEFHFTRLDIVMFLSLKMHWTPSFHDNLLWSFRCDLNPQMVKLLHAFEFSQCSFFLFVFLSHTLFRWVICDETYTLAQLMWVNLTLSNQIFYSTVTSGVIFDKFSLKRVEKIFHSKLDQRFSDFIKNALYILLFYRCQSLNSKFDFL